MNHLSQYYQLQSLKKSFRLGSVEGVMRAIEKHFDCSYLDSAHRNLLMLVMKYDTENRLRIISILIDAKADINHTDPNGWNVLHYACAYGAFDVLQELVRRGARVVYNRFGFGPEDFVIPKYTKTNTLLEQTTQLEHEKITNTCWDFFDQTIQAKGYAIQGPRVAELGTPVKFTFRTIMEHHAKDRLRIVKSSTKQGSKSGETMPNNVFYVPPGEVGSICIDQEIFRQAGKYRIYYERYGPEPRTTVLDKPEEEHSSNQEEEIITQDPKTPPIEEYVDSSYTIVAMTRLITIAMANASITTDEYEMRITEKGAYGLILDGMTDSEGRSNRVLVRGSSGQSAGVNPGDFLVSVGDVFVEYAGLRHAIWALNEAPRPVVLRFRNGNKTPKKNMIDHFRLSRFGRKNSCAIEI